MHIQFPTSITLLINQWPPIHDTRGVRTSFCSVQFRAIDEPSPPRLMSFYWWVIYAYPPFAKNRGIKKEKEEKKREKRKKKKKVKNVGIFHTRSCAPLSSHLPSLLLLPPSPRSYARHYSRRFHADPRCPHGSSTVKHTVDIGETVLAINPEYRQKPGLYGRGGRRKRREGRPHRWNCPRRWEKMEKEDSSRASIDVSFFSLSLSSLLFFYFFLQRRHAILCRDSFSTDRSRKELWEMGILDGRRM